MSRFLLNCLRSSRRRRTPSLDDRSAIHTSFYQMKSISIDIEVHRASHVHRICISRFDQLLAERGPPLGTVAKNRNR
ncbi:uncharacterized protein METZ01_LOCUS365425, partial [marine metagenome]